MIDRLVSWFKPDVSRYDTTELLRRGLSRKAFATYSAMLQAEDDESKVAGERLYGFRMCTQNKARRLAAMSVEQVKAALRAGENAQAHSLRLL